MAMVKLPTILSLGLILLPMLGGVQGQPEIDGSGTIDSLQAPGGFPAIHLVGLASE